MSKPSPPPSNPTSQVRGKFHEAPLYAILDTTLRKEGALLAIAEALLRAGISVIQYRHKGKFGRKNFEECQTLVALIHRSGGVFLVNDRADVAALCGADGVHLGQEDLPPAKARQLLGTARIIGYSTHTLEQAAVADTLPVDYVAVGPVFPTRTKQHPDPVVDLSGIAGARCRTEKPLVGIGGITLQNAPSVLQSGADAVAVIGDLLLAGDVELRAREFLAALRPERI